MRKISHWIKNNISIFIDGIFLLLLIVLFTLFIIGFVFKINLLSPISGIAIIVCLIAMTVNILTSKGKIKVFDWIVVIIYYLTSILFICAYLASEQNDALRETLVSIASATIGGLLTLTGVGITIKYSRLSKEEDEIKKCMPRVFPISPTTWQITDKKTSSLVSFDLWKTNLLKPNQKDATYCIKTIFLATTDLSMCIYDGLIIDGNELWFDFGTVLQKDHNYMLIHNLEFALKEQPKDIYLLLTDMLDNTYRAKMTFDLIENESSVQIEITSILGTELYIPNNKNSSYLR